MLNLVILASGRGSNFEAILNNCKSGHLNARISLLLSNKSEAKALATAKKEDIAAKAVLPNVFADQDAYEAALLEEIAKAPCDLIVLAGYMKILGSYFITNAPVPIVNIHPSLLPSFPGLHAQAQAVDYGVKVSGCTVHFVDAGLDSGPIICQKAVPVLEGDDEESLSARILKEEHKLYSEAIGLIADGKIKNDGRIVRIDN